MTASARKRGTTTADLIVDGLKSFLRDIRQNPSATIVELRVGRPASKEILKRALDRAHMPLELLQLASRMSGFTLEWTSRPRRRQRQLGGGVDVPTLARQLKGWDDLAFNEHPDSDIGVCVVDVAPATSDGLFACYADGDLGVWHQNDDTFHVEGFGLEEYFEAGIRNLFVPGWLSHVLEEGFDSIAPDAIEARELLNIPLPQPENDSAPANLQVESFSKIDWLPLPSGAHQGQTLPQAFMEDPAYVLKAARAGDFRGALHDQTLKVCERARRVRVPPKGEKCVVVYYLDAAGNYDKQSIVDADYPRRWPEPNAVTLTSNCIDLTMAMRIAPRDSSAPMAIIEWLKYKVFGDSRALTREFCDGFFNIPENFYGQPHHDPLDLVRVSPRKGTRFRYMNELNPGDHHHVLPADTEVEVLRLASEPGEMGYYLMNGRVIAVAYADEKRNRRDNGADA